LNDFKNKKRQNYKLNHSLKSDSLYATLNAAIARTESSTSNPIEIAHCLEHQDYSSTYQRE